MKTWPMRAVLLALAIASAPPVAAQRGQPAPVVTRLDNGLTVAVFRDTRLPLSQIQLVVPAGSDQETLLESGVANLVAATITLGTTTRSRETFEREAAETGGRVAAVANREYATLGATCLTDGLPGAMALVAEAAREPSLLADTFDGERDRVLGGIVEERRSGPALASTHLPAFALAGLSTGRPVPGVAQTVERLTVQSLRAFHRRCYKPDRALLVVATDADPAVVARLAEEHFGSWAGKANEVLPQPVKAEGGLRIRIVDLPTRGGVELRLAVPGPGRGDADAVAISALGRWIETGAVPRLRAARVSAPRTETVLLRDGGLVVVAGSAPVDSAAAAVRALRSALRSLPELAPDAASAQSLRAYLSGRSRAAFDSPGGWITQWIDYRLFAPAGADFDAYSRRWEALGPADLKRVSERWLRGADGWVVAVGPAARLRPLLEPLGRVEVVAADAPAIALPALPSQITAEPTLRELTAGRQLLNAALEAHGGRDRLEKIRDTSMDGEIELRVAGRAQIGTLRQVSLVPGRFTRTTVIANSPAQQTLDGDTGWMRTDATGDSAVSLPAADVERLRRDAEDFRALLLACADPRVRVASRGRESVGITETEVLEAVHPERGRHLLLLDAETRRVLAIDETRVADGDSVTLRHRYGDWRLVDGVHWPFYEDQSVRGELLVLIRLSSVRFNSGVMPSAFARPSEPRRFLKP